MELNLQNSILRWSIHWGGEGDDFRIHPVPVFFSEEQTPFSGKIYQFLCGKTQQVVYLDVLGSIETGAVWGLSPKETTIEVPIDGICGPFEGGEEWEFQEVCVKNSLMKHMD